MIYGYARVSTDAQDLTNQLAALKAAGCEKIFRDKLTGAHAERPQLQRLLRTVTQGDVVLVAAVDRLSRDTTDLLVIARDLEKAGAGLRSIAEPLIDTTSDFKELILAIFGIAAKLERRRIIDRTARGRADAKAKGVKFGRKPKLTQHQKREAIKRRDKAGRNVALDCAKLQCQRGDDWEAFCLMAEGLGVPALYAPSGSRRKRPKPLRVFAHAGDDP